jgi:hypothetical protein
MILYHVTSSENAAAIKRDGFRDTGGMTESERRAVWLSDRPLDANEGARDDRIGRAAMDRGRSTAGSIRMD